MRERVKSDRTRSFVWNVELKYHTAHGRSTSRTGRPSSDSQLTCRGPSRPSYGIANPAPPPRPVPVYSPPTRRSASSTSQREAVRGAMVNDTTNFDIAKKASKVSLNTSRA
ncbi:hypothetical protein NHQ30_000912 [Ciborinia camelliae]|nr:hypothetical protein NHQ30_000912 [Ciborinia camelliae]